jgi:hypothetical protein
LQNPTFLKVSDLDSMNQHLIGTANIPKYSPCTHETLVYIQQHPEAKAILHLAMRDGRNSLFTRNCPTRPEILRGSDILFRWCDAIKNLGVGKRAREKFRDEATASVVKNALQILVTELWCPMSASTDQLRAAIHGGFRNGKGVLTCALKQARFVISELREDLRIPFDESRLSFPSKLIQLPELNSLPNYGKHEEEILTPASAMVGAAAAALSAVGGAMTPQAMISTNPTTATLSSTTGAAATGATLPPDFSSWSRLELGSHKELTPTSSSFSLPSPPLLSFLQQPIIPLTVYDSGPPLSFMSPRETRRSASFHATSLPFQHSTRLQDDARAEEKDIATLLLQMKDQPPHPTSSSSRLESSPPLSVDFHTQRNIRSHSRSSSCGGKFHHRHGSFGGGSVDTDLNETEDDEAESEMDGTNKFNPHYVTCGSSFQEEDSGGNGSGGVGNGNGNYFESFMSLMIHAGYATHLLSDPAHLDEWILKVIFLMNYELVASETPLLCHRQHLSLIPSSSAASDNDNDRPVFHLICSGNGTGNGSLRICYGDYDANDILFPRAVALKILEKLRRCGEIKSSRQQHGNIVASGVSGSCNVGVDDSGESEWKETEREKEKEMEEMQQMPPANKRLKCQ